MAPTEDDLYDALEVTRSFRLTSSEDAALRARAVALDRSHGWVIRQALREYLERASGLKVKRRG